jgi:polygalacturonase
MRTGKILLLLTAILLVCLPGCRSKKPTGRFTITDFGAKGDGRTLNTAAINETIKACADRGGGTVIIPAGKFVTGPVELLANVTLHLESGAVLKGSANLQDYRVGERRFGLIRARNADNVAITGHGTIDGIGTSFMDMNTPRNYPFWTPEDIDPNYTRQGQNYMQAKFGTADGPVVYSDRPGRMAIFVGCRNVLIRDVTFADAPSWTVQLDDCEDVVVSGIRIKNSLLVPNSDGIHCTSCRNVHISDCEISAGDDCIAITCINNRSRQQPPVGGKTDNITVTNCTLQSRSAGVRVGYTGGDIQNVIMSNLTIRESNRGLLVNARDGGSVKNVLFSDITIQTRLHTGHWWGQAEPIHVSAIRMDANDPNLGVISNVRFSNIVAESESGIVLWSEQPNHLRDISLENVKLKIKNSPLNDSYGGNIDLRTTYDLKFGIFKYDIAGLYAYNTTGLRISDFQIEWDENLPEFFNHAIWCEHFDNLTIDGFTGRQPHKADTRAAIALNNGSNVTIKNCQAAEGTGVFLSHSDVTDQRLFVNNDLSKAQKSFEPEKSEFRDFGNFWPK